MRFDDRIATVLAQPEAGERALIDKWRQLVDLLAQRPMGSASPAAREALCFVAQRRLEIPEGIRRWAADIFPQDADLEMGSPAPAATTFGAAYPASATPPEHGGAPGEIREILQRIQSYRGRAGIAKADPASCFQWESGPEGLILWVDGVAREALVGRTIASGPGEADYSLQEAIRKRAPFRDVLVGVPGSGAGSGEWLLSGVPMFHPFSEHFLGYRGRGRRALVRASGPRVGETGTHESGEAAGEGLLGDQLPPDALRQLVHELRTPLNAILGFSEMIDGELLGPAAGEYRHRARTIKSHAERLLATVDDLDTAARVEGSRAGRSSGRVDLARLVRRIGAEFPGSVLQLSAANDLPRATVEEEAAGRILVRLLGLAALYSDRGEAVMAALLMGRHQGARMLRLSVTRPRALQVNVEQLLDAAFDPNGGEGGPALGPSFTLRLVSALSEAAGGALEIDANSFVLWLPAEARH